MGLRDLEENIKIISTENTPSNTNTKESENTPQNWEKKTETPPKNINTNDENLTEEEIKQGISKKIDKFFLNTKIQNETKKILEDEITNHFNNLWNIKKIDEKIEKEINKICKAIKELENPTTEQIKKIINECFEPKYSSLNINNEEKWDSNKNNKKKENIIRKKEMQGMVDESFEKDHKELFESVIKSYENLNPKYKTTDQEKLNKKKESLSKDTKEKLEKVWGKEAVDQYVNFLCSKDIITEKINNNEEDKDKRNEILKDPNVKEFLVSLDTFEEQLWIESDKTVWGYPTSFNANKDDIDNSTKNIQEFASKDNFQELNIDYMGDLSRKDAVDLIEKYRESELITDNIKNHEDIEKCFDYIKANTDLLKKDHTEYTDEEKKIIQKAAWTIKYCLTEDIWSQIRNSITFAPIASIMRYLDWDKSLGGLSIADQLTQWNNKMQEEEGWTFTIQWEVDWSPICFYYEFSQWQAQLKCEDYLHYNKDENSIKLYKEWENSKTNLNIPIPSKEDLSKIFANIWEDEYRKIFFESDPKEYNQKVAELISSKIESWFPNNPMVWIRIRRHAEKNLAVGKFKNTLIPNGLENEISEKLWSAENNDLKQLFQYLDNTTEQATGSDLQRLRNALNKLDWFLSVPDEEFTKDRTTDKKLLKLFHDLSDWTSNDTENKNYNERENSMTKFFRLFYKKENTGNWTKGEEGTQWTIDIDAFEECLELFEKPDKKLEDAKSNIIKENLPNLEAEELWETIQKNYPPEPKANPNPRESST